MIACTDVHYKDDDAVAACILFRDWPDDVGAGHLIEHVCNVWQYEPGRFYLRELPCLLAVLGKVTEPIECIGLSLWEKTKKDFQIAEKIRDFLLTNGKLDNDLKGFLSSASPQELVDKLFCPITWEAESPHEDYVKESIRRKLILHGDKYYIPPSRSEKVISRLLEETLTTACKKELRFLDKALFFRIFEEETTVRIPTYQVELRKQIGQTLNCFPQPFASNTHEGFLLPSVPLILSSIPPLPEGSVRREKIIENMKNSLNDTGLMLLYGSTGMGKTTLAKLVVTADDDKWLWLNLSGSRSFYLPQILREVALIIDQDKEKINIVFDDLDLSSRYAQGFEDYFGGLIYTIFKRNGKIIITSKKGIPSRMSTLLNIHSKNIFNVPPFDEDEIIQFAQHLNCKDEAVAKRWAKVLLLQTKGHPLLIHIRLKYLSESQWPDFKPEDLFQSPSDIARGQSGIREMIIGQLSVEHRELLYRLSIMIGPFRYDHALKIGDIPPRIRHPGDLFEQLSGPWIESIGGGYYRLSPLLDGVAKLVWSKERLLSLHEDIGKAIIKCGRLSSLEAEKIFYHAWNSRSTELLISVVRGFINAPEKIQKSIAYNLSWITHIGTDPIRIPIPEDIHTNFAFRMIQLMIAVIAESKIAPKIIAAIDKEIIPHEPHNLYLLERYMLATKALLYFQIDMPPKKLLAFLREIIETEEQLHEVRDIFSTIKSHHYAPLQDPITILFSFILPRCSNSKYLNELLEGLKEMPKGIFQRIVSLFKVSEGYATYLIDGVWLAEADKEIPNWDECIEVFRKTIAFAVENGLPSLAIAASKSIAIIYDEYMDDPDRAFQILDETTAKLGMHPMLEDERATILYRREQYSDALEIWNDILPKWSPQPSNLDTSYIYAYRKAGIAAAKTDNWHCAADFFLKGYELSKPLSLIIRTFGFYADAGFAFWKASEYKEFIEIYKEVMYGIEKFTNQKEDLKVFTFIKRFGHSLLWIKYNLSGESTEEIAIPPPGMCSNPEFSVEVRELPSMPVAFSWVLLAQIELYLNFDYSIFEYVKSRFEGSPYPGIRLFIADLEVKHAFRRQDFNELPSLSRKLETAFADARKHHSAGKEPWEESEENEISEDLFSDKLMFRSELFIAALISMASGEKLDKGIFKIWEENEKKFPVRVDLLEWIILAENIFSLNAYEATGIMKNTDENREKRLLAALRLGIDEEVKPDVMFYAHALLVESLLKGPWAEHASDYLAKLFSHYWLLKIQFPTALRMPQFTVPAILSACNSEAKGTQKIAQVLLAVSMAVSIHLPEDFVKQLHILSNSQGFRRIPLLQSIER